MSTSVLESNLAKSVRNLAKSVVGRYAIKHRLIDTQTHRCNSRSLLLKRVPIPSAGDILRASAWRAAHPHAVITPVLELLKRNLRRLRKASKRFGEEFQMGSGSVFVEIIEAGC